MLSKRATEVLGKYMNRFFEFLEAWINDCPFFLLRRIGALDCVDKANSEFEAPPDDPNHMLIVRRYRFFKDRIPDPLIFPLPDTRGGLFATDSINSIVEQSTLKGFHFFDAE